MERLKDIVQLQSIVLSDCAKWNSQPKSAKRKLAVLTCNRTTKKQARMSPDNLSRGWLWFSVSITPEGAVAIEDLEKVEPIYLKQVFQNNSFNVPSEGHQVAFPS